MRKSMPRLTYENPVTMAIKWTVSITSFFSPVAKCIALEECTQDDNSLTHPEMELKTTDTDDQSSTDIAYFVIAAPSMTPDQVKYRIERRPPLNVSIHNKVYKDSNRKGGMYQRRCNSQWFDIIDFLATLGLWRVFFASHVYFSLLVMLMKGSLSSLPCDQTIS